MTRKTREVMGDSEMVQSEECKRWCYLDEAVFASLAEADGAKFACRLCDALNRAVRRMEQKWTASVEQLKGELRAEREHRTELEIQIGKLLEEERARVGLLERSVGEFKEERKRQVELDERVEPKIMQAAGSTGSEQHQAEDEGQA